MTTDISIAPPAPAGATTGTRGAQAGGRRADGGDENGFAALVGGLVQAEDAERPSTPAPARDAAAAGNAAAPTLPADDDDAEAPNATDVTLGACLLGMMPETPDSRGTSDPPLASGTSRECEAVAAADLAAGAEAPLPAGTNDPGAAAVLPTRVESGVESRTMMPATPESAPESSSESADSNSMARTVSIDAASERQGSRSPRVDVLSVASSMEQVDAMEPHVEEPAEIGSETADTSVRPAARRTATEPSGAANGRTVAALQEVLRALGATDAEVVTPATAAAADNQPSDAVAEWTAAPADRSRRSMTEPSGAGSRDQVPAFGAEISAAPVMAIAGTGTSGQPSSFANGRRDEPAYAAPMPHRIAFDPGSAAPALVTAPAGLTAATTGEAAVAEVAPPGSSPAGTAAEAGDVPQQIVRAVRLQWQQGIGEAKLQLQPEHLGAVAITLRVENGAVTASVRAESPVAREWIQGHQQELRTALADQGLRLDSLDVDPDRSGRHDRRGDEREEPAVPRPRRPRGDTPIPAFDVRV